MRCEMIGSQDIDMGEGNGKNATARDGQLALL